MSVNINRPISKAIAATNISSDVIYRLCRLSNGGNPPTRQEVERWLEMLRVPLAEVILPHLDAYDQRG